MKKSKKRWYLILLTTFLVLSLAIVPALGSTDYVAADPYVVAYSFSDSLEYENELPYMYVSPHRGSLGIRNYETGQMEYWNVGYDVYNLVDTTAESDSTNTAYASIPVYCTDACISAREGVAYKRTNLENCTYYKEGIAGKIRAVCQNSFPYIKDISLIEKNANSWLATAKPDATLISNLTGAEVIAATQYSIWCIANEDDIEMGSPYTQTSSISQEDFEEIIIEKDSYVDCTEGKRETTSNNIKMLHEYYMSLEPITANEILIANDSIEIIDLNHQKQKDETFTATITFRVNATINEDDHVTVSAICGDLTATRALTTSDIQTITLEGLSGHDDVTIAIDGGQKSNGIFLFVSEGGREGSQTMVGYNDSFLPCHAEEVASCDGTEPQIPVEDPVPPENDITPPKPEIPSQPSDETTNTIPDKEPIETPTEPPSDKPTETPDNTPTKTPTETSNKLITTQSTTQPKIPSTKDTLGLSLYVLLLVLSFASIKVIHSRRH